MQPGDFLNPERRQLQADFTVATAQQALAAKDVAVFMPFILVHDKDPHALTVSPEQPLPAWTAYADFTRQHPFPSRMLALPLRDPNPVVVQWMPDNQTTIPHKVSGTYRFREGQAIRGVLRIYNFSDKPASGRLEAPALRHVFVVIDSAATAESRSCSHPGGGGAAAPQLPPGAATPSSRLPDDLGAATPSSRMVEDLGAATPSSRMMKDLGDATPSSRVPEDGQRPLSERSLGRICRSMVKQAGKPAPRSESILNNRQSGDAPRSFCSSDLTVPSMGKIEIPISFVPESPGYFREYWQAEFVDDHRRRSPVYFGLEAMPQERDFIAVPMELGPVMHGKIGQPMFHEFAMTSSSGVWTGINGLAVVAGRAEAGPTETLKAETGKSEKREPADQSFLQEVTKGTEQFPASMETVASVCDRRPEAGAMEGGALSPPIALKAWVTKAENDPLRPTMAVAGIKGLPLHGFLRLQLDQPMSSDFKVRVDLVDRHGQRFTIWENLGASYYGPRDDVWLNLDDFHVYFWGRCSDQPVFHPEAIEEIQLRFYFAKANDPRRVELTLLKPRERN